MSPPRPDRALYLARLLISRLRDLEEALLDNTDPDKRSKVERQQDLVVKVLAVEAGVTDGPTVQLVANALPRVDLTLPVLDRDVSELAAFLRAQLKI